MHQDLHTYKELQDFGNLELLAKQVVEGFITGLHKSPFHGFSVEFAEHRLYNAGDSVKNIDWKLYGRADKLFVKRFEEETNLRCQLVIDTSSSMYYPAADFNKLRFSVYCAAALMYLLKRQRDAFGLSLFSDSVEFSSPAKSTSVHQKYLFGELEKLLGNSGKDKKTGLADALHQIAEQIHKRSLVVVFTDLMQTGSTSIPSILSALQHLKYKKHEIVIFNVVEQKNEVEFAFENRPYHFIDLETGEELKLHPHLVKEQYLQLVENYQKELKTKCGQYGIEFIDADINNGFYQVLHTYLIKRAKML